MKIAVVIPKYGLLGGAESFAYELTERLAGHRGFEIHVFANQWRHTKSRIAFHKIPIIGFPRFLRPISFAFFCDRQISSKNFDLIHAHDRIFQMDLFTIHGIPHKIWIKKARRKSLSLFDRSMAWVEKRGIRGSLEPMILPVSTLVKDELLRMYDVPNSRVHVIHPGVSIERFSLLDRESCRHEIRQNHSLAQDDIVVLFVGMNFETKGLELVLRGTADLVAKKNNKPDLKLLVVGKGKRDKYLALARLLGIADRVSFAGVTREVEKYYLACDIFAMPSLFDAFGIAVLEAMVAGLPVIISQGVGAKDVIRSGVQGFILPGNPSVSDMSAALALLMEPNKRAEMGESGRKVALTYEWNGAAKRVAELYQRMATERVT